MLTLESLAKYINSTTMDTDIWAEIGKDKYDKKIISLMYFNGPSDMDDSFAAIDEDWCLDTGYGSTDLVEMFESLEEMSYDPELDRDIQFEEMSEKTLFELVLEEVLEDNEEYRKNLKYINSIVKGALKKI